MKCEAVLAQMICSTSPNGGGPLSWRTEALPEEIKKRHAEGAETRDVGFH